MFDILAGVWRHTTKQTDQHRFHMILPLYNHTKRILICPSRVVKSCTKWLVSNYVEIRTRTAFALEWSLILCMWYLDNPADIVKRDIPYSVSRVSKYNASKFPFRLHSSPVRFPHSLSLSSEFPAQLSPFHSHTMVTGAEPRPWLMAV